MKRLLSPRLPRSGRTRLLVLLGLALLLLAGAGGWMLLRGDESAEVQPTSATVGTQTLRQSVTANGTLQAATTAELSFDVSGTVDRVDVAVGDTVVTGQRLARVDDEVLAAQLKAARSALTAARSARAEHLDAGSSDEQTAADTAAVAAAESAVAEAEEALEGAVLRSTTSGMVTAVGLEVGQRVGGQSGAGNTGESGAGVGSTGTTGAITVVSSGSFVVEAQVASADIAEVKKGLQAELTVSGVEGVVYGTVAEVGLVAEPDTSGAATFPVTIAVTGQRDDLYGGTAAEVAIIVSQRTEVLTVDSRALRSDGDLTYVDKVTDLEAGTTERVEVTTGETSGLATEVVSGLSAGDVVEVPGLSFPRGGGDQRDRGGRQNGDFPGPPGGFSVGIPGGFPGGGQVGGPGGSR